MKLSSRHRWDWASAILLIFMLQFAVSRLVITQWTEFLYFSQTLAALGLALGLALGYSQYKGKAVTLLVLGYSIVIIPWQLSFAIEDVYFSDRLASVGGRLLFSTDQFFQRAPVEDGLLFVAFISTLMWFISLVSGYWWARHKNYLVTVLPGGVFTLVIHLYDPFSNSRIWILAIYILLALMLLGQLYYQRNRESWRERGVFLMQESTFDLTRGVVIASSIFIFAAWTVPASQAGLDSAMRTWKRLTEPWRDMQEWFSNAVEGLESPSIREADDLYGSQLRLGAGNPLSEDVLFTVEAPDLPAKQPRYYWRGYVYSLYQNYSWYVADSTSDEFFPENLNLPIPDMDERTVVNFTFKTWMQQSLLYTATQPLWVSRPGRISYARADTDEQDLIAWRTEPRLSSGEQYQVSAAMINPSMQQLQNAGTHYPQWVEDRYLQLPDDFSPRIRELTSQITQGLETPYEKATAITEYLRSEIEYANPLPEAPPEGEDPVEWFLFDLKKGFCNYYASAEVLMLRSQGIPARMAVGFAEGVQDEDSPTYSVRSLDAHAWPEVYFPGMGWVEFEPTGNQAPLIRPDRPEDEDPNNLEETDDALDPFNLDPREDNSDLNIPEENLSDIETVTVAEQPLNPLYYPAAAAILLALFWLINRRYAVVDHIPARLQSAYERNGGRPPAWLVNWARWAALSPIARTFETINRSLYLLGEKPAIHATPAERADLLTNTLPKARDAIETLKEQHQKSLFTPEPGNPGSARRASLFIWLYTIQHIVLNFFDERSVDKKGFWD